MFTQRQPAEEGASNRLYNGDVRDFGHAMDLVRQQCRDEQGKNALGRREAGAHPSEADGQYLAGLAESDRQLEAYAELAAAAKAVWQEELRAARDRTVERLKARPEPEMHDIAFALERDDYSDLAI